MKEEDIIKQMTEGRENPFRVPDGYFEGFTSRMMSQLPVAEQKPKRLTYLWRYAAVLVVACGVGLTFLLTNRTNDNLAEGEASEEYQEDYINDALDYALIGNTNIEIYLTEAY